MAKKIFFFLIVICLINTSVRAEDEIKDKGDKYSELVVELEIYYDLFEGFVENVEKTNDEEGMLNVINNFADKIDLQISRILKIKEKYPELENAEVYPDNLQLILNKITLFLNSKKIKDAEKKTIKYKDKNEKIERAFNRLQKILQK